MSFLRMKIAPFLLLVTATSIPHCSAQGGQSSGSANNKLAAHAAATNMSSKWGAGQESFRPGSQNAGKESFGNAKQSEGIWREGAVPGANPGATGIVKSPQPSIGASTRGHRNSHGLAVWAKATSGSAGSAVKSNATHPSLGSASGGAGSHAKLSSSKPFATSHSKFGARPFRQIGARAGSKAKQGFRTPSDGIAKPAPNKPQTGLPALNGLQTKPQSPPY